MTTPLPALANLQWSLDDLIVMGPGSTYNVQTFSFGAAANRTQDAVIPGHDGERFGVDTLSGRLITLDLNTDCYTEDEGLDALDVFEGAWDAEGVRREPGAVSVLRWRRGGRVRRAYGRSRDCLPDHSMDWTGNIPITATFRTVEPRFYDDTERTESVPLVPEEIGGLIGDIIGDIIASGQGVGTRGFDIGGTRPTWTPIVIYGPISNPSLEFVDQWSLALNLTIGEGDGVLIDPTPWNRDVRRLSDGANLAGKLTADSRILSAMQLAPGHHEAILRGVDPTGTAQAVVFWRDCYASH